MEQIAIVGVGRQAFMLMSEPWAVEPVELGLSYIVMNKLVPPIVGGEIDFPEHRPLRKRMLDTKLNKGKRIGYRTRTIKYTLLYSVNDF